MPLHRYQCRDCGSETELFLKFRYDKETKDTELEIPTHCGWDHWAEDASSEPCGSENIHKCLPRGFGIHGQSTGPGCDARGYFSASLGRYVKSMKDERDIMEKSGFVPLSDLGGDNWWNEKVEQKKTQKQAQDALENKYKDLVDSGVSKEDAVMETWTAKDAVDGTLDKTYDDSIKI